MTFSQERDIPDLAGKVVIVTGGSSGLGKESVIQLAKHNPAAIYLTARTEARGNAAIRENKIKYLELDLGSFASIKKSTDAFLTASDRLDILMNNAGLMATPPGLTTDGYEVQFGSNYMGPALFTKLLLPILNKTAEQPGSDVRVVNLSSELFKQAPSDGILIAKCKTPLDDISSLARYVHPGVVKTGLFDDFRKRRPWVGGVISVLGSIFLTDVHAGARAQLWASTAASASVKSGGFYNPKFKEYKEANLYDDKAAQELCDWTEKELEGQ
ncbi:retinol dehydrogenase [Colletotrichum phormii]|uniref:Retinol dehydrogenase n=1 Tax=Colletotrichum phormii TaxID=359342 RepID=A0AAJ0EEC9_9PEZI|nr:retinol dehydrogenase [Colletotrichum phormii]KAK1635889.1 retinol dehydrogenase [Colletotrichum phormii]